MRNEKFKIILARNDDDSDRTHSIFDGSDKQRYEFLKTSLNSSEIDLLYRKERSPVIIMDIGRQVVCAVELVRLTRYSITNTSTHILVITGYDNARFVLNLIRNGANDVIVSPYDSNNLQIILDSLIYQSNLIKTRGIIFERHSIKIRGAVESLQAVSKEIEETARSLQMASALRKQDWRIQRKR